MGPQPEGQIYFGFVWLFVLISFLITWKPNPLTCQNSSKCHCPCFWLSLKARISKETWAPLLHKENKDADPIGNDLALAGLTCWFLTSSWRIVTYPSGASQHSGRQTLLGQVPNACLHRDEGARQSCWALPVSDTMAKIHPTVFYHPTWHCLSRLRGFIDY